VEKLLQNYRSGFLQLAYYYSTLPDTTTGKLPDESLDKLMANFDRLPNRQKSLAVLLRMEELIPESVRPISSPELSVQVGRMYADLGRPEELRRRLEMAAERETPRLETQVRLAAAWAAFLNDTARAQQILAKALGESPTAQQSYAAGRELYSSGAFTLAAEYFEKAFALDPNDGQTVGALLQCYENMGDSPRAIATLERWVGRHPQDRAAQQRLDQLRGHTLTDTTTTPRSHQ
jgi:tetratricopeptide (TPR) repeat protein